MPPDVCCITAAMYWSVLLYVQSGCGDSRHGRVGLGEVVPTMLLVSMVAEAVSVTTDTVLTSYAIWGRQLCGKLHRRRRPCHMLVLL
jgi:hypothetical protein